MRGPRLLKRYLTETQQRAADLSRAARVDQAQLSRWLSGQGRPDIDSAARLERATGGKVPILAWENGKTA